MGEAANTSPTARYEQYRNYGSAVGMRRNSSAARSINRAVERKGKINPERIKMARRITGMTPVEAAEAAGVSANSVRTWERSERPEKIETVCFDLYFAWLESRLDWVTEDWLRNPDPPDRFVAVANPERLSRIQSDLAISEDDMAQLIGKDTWTYQRIRLGTEPHYLEGAKLVDFCRSSAINFDWVCGLTDINDDWSDKAVREEPVVQEVTIHEVSATLSPADAAAIADRMFEHAKSHGSRTKVTVNGEEVFELLDPGGNTVETMDESYVNDPEWKEHRDDYLDFLKRDGKLTWAVFRDYLGKGYRPNGVPLSFTAPLEDTLMRILEEDDEPRVETRMANGALAPTGPCPTDPMLDYIRVPVEELERLRGYEVHFAEMEKQRNEALAPLPLTDLIRRALAASEATDQLLAQRNLAAEEVERMQRALSKVCEERDQALKKAELLAGAIKQLNEALVNN